MSMSHNLSVYEAKNAQHSPGGYERDGGRSPTFTALIMESDRDVEDLVVTSSPLERTSHFQVEERGKDRNGAKKEDDPKAA